ncbi:hypothetical protein HMPREF7215_2047 [Pyramidobacter piscolens W5455]|uniref:Uncharacterized protein n=1 Tax=Pyramidobacter piscolens W5455 TaxID=352165 RepID=A0ABM9ZXP7_9BACT|nr:hypothetical protein HMPREF7215_2047 [Pyramidobacter piscolens W5455]
MSFTSPKEKTPPAPPRRGRAGGSALAAPRRRTDPRRGVSFAYHSFNDYIFSNTRAQ